MISQVTFTSSSVDTRAPGLIGHVRCLYGDLLLDRLELRRTGSGRLTLRFPAERDLGPVVRPLDDEARRRIEDAVLTALGLR